MSSSLAICTVTHNAAADLPGYLAAVGRLDYRPAELMIVDCASEDGSVDVARAHLPDSIPSRIVALDHNAGFAGGINRAIEETAGDFILSLNADTVPEPDFANALVERFGEPGGPRLGAVTPRLIRPRTEGRVHLDAAGMRLVPT